MCQSAAERLLVAADDPSGSSAGSGLRTCSLRPAIVYGERDVSTFAPNLRLYSAGADGGRLQIGDNTNHVSVTYTYNSAWAHIEAARRLVGDPRDLPVPAVWDDAPVSASPTRRL